MLTRKSLYKIERDVELVKQEARIIFKICPDWTETHENKKGRLNVIAILGPSVNFGREFEEVLLAEIGIRRTRPYTEARGLSRKFGESNLPERKNIFSLTEEQYLQAAPPVFDFFQKYTNDRVSGWANNDFSNPFYISTPHFYWSRKMKKLFHSYGKKPWPRGIRFTVSLKDEFFIKDIFWAEFNLNPHTKKRLEGLARFIDLRLIKYRNCYRNFLKLKGVLDVQKVVKNSSLPAYLISETLEFLPKKTKNPLWFEINDLLNHNRSREKFLRENSLPNQIDRLKNIHVRVTTTLNKRNFITFEVLPQK